MKKVISIIIVVMVACLVGNSLNVNAEEDEYIYSDCVIEEGVAEEIAVPEEEIELNSSTVTLKWNVKANILKKTGSFYKKAGSKIYTNIQVNCSKKIRIGIIKDGKTKQYYETKTGGVKTFNITTAGQYNVFVQNVTNSTIKAEGYYIK